MSVPVYSVLLGSLEKLVGSYRDALALGDKGRINSRCASTLFINAIECDLTQMREAGFPLEEMSEIHTALARIRREYASVDDGGDLDQLLQQSMEEIEQAMRAPLAPSTS